ncbi:trimeric intracellular cation channel family protein [Anaerosphaera multitolerans]|uniref:Trimeric intracellular cation channel family protein n=1 Tax=Anaerosphaera multitolerans TaxID=2487351 RepID=A0A437S9W7_9FIRM|nr:trimeric intracellular cation channel family protein [Anaerosphaera multitolerans]RVU55588.1 trimeric intracellular cation channel family protein [Anaerosphaera multitolerans]
MLVYSKIGIILEIIGTLAFASSGALVAIRKKMDVFGTVVLGVVTALGGGCIRDIILGINPPNMFRNSSYALQAVAASVILFIVFYYKSDYLKSDVLKSYENVMIILDAIGLGAFTVTGINTAVELGYTDEKFLLIFVGMVTGIGGGIIRDLFSNEVPFVFKEQIYAVSSFIGACFFLLFRNIMGYDTLLIGSALVVVITRIIAVRKNLNLPKIDYED